MFVVAFVLEMVPSNSPVTASSSLSQSPVGRSPLESSIDDLHRPLRTSCSPTAAFPQILHVTGRSRAAHSQLPAPNLQRLTSRSHLPTSCASASALPTLCARLKDRSCTSGVCICDKELHLTGNADWFGKRTPPLRPQRKVTVRLQRIWERKISKQKIIRIGVPLC